MPLMPQPVKLPEGVKIQIKLNMGRVADRVKEVARIELLRGFIGMDNEVPLILNNVKVGR